MISRNTLLFFCCISTALIAENGYTISAQAITFRGNPSPQQIADAQNEFAAKASDDRLPELIANRISEEALLCICKAFPDIQHFSLLFSPDINDLAVLGQLPELRFLRLAGLPAVRDWNIPGELSELNSLELQHLPVESLEFLAFQSRLQKLTVNLPALTDFSAIAALVNLKSLSITTGQFDNLKFLQPLKNLQFLDLSCFAVDDFTPLSHLDQLQILRLSFQSQSTQTIQLNFLNSLTGLHQLQLKNMTLSGVEHLASLKKMVYLNLESCQGLISLEPLKNLPELRTLRLPGNTFSPEQLNVLRRGISIHFAP